MIAWFNGDLLPLGGVSIAATDRGFLLGDGFFETMAVEASNVHHFDAHMKRLLKTSNKLSLPIPYSHDEIKDAIQNVLVGCQLTKCRAAIRLTVTRGSGPRGLLLPLEIKPQILITASEVPDHFSSAKVKTVSIRRNEFSPTSTIKTLCYLDNVLAFEEAHNKGGDEALMLNTQGHIAEGSVSNIFFIKDNILYTPPVSDGCLPGIMRSEILRVAEQLSLICCEESLNPDITQTCDEAFLTNSLWRVRTIYEIDERRMPAETWAVKLLAILKDQE